MSRRYHRPKPRASQSHRSLAFRRQLLLGCWILAGGGLLARAADLQVAEGAKWRQKADDQHRMESEVAAERGAIVDRDGVPLALSHETFSVGVAPHELEDRTAAASSLEAVLQLSGAEASRITSSDGPWVNVAGRFPPAVREALAGLQGVYLERELRRFYPQGALGRGLLGAVVDKVGSGGIEQEFEGHLRGIPGAEIVARDSNGRPIPGESWMIRPPRSGGSVVLTLDASLQEIANEALREAVESTGSRGGDLLVTDPHTGEVLAMVSLRDATSANLGAINAPYEPGSTLKPFTVASLLRERKASLDDSLDTGNGSWTTHGRTIDDVSAVGGGLTPSRPSGLVECRDSQGRAATEPRGAVRGPPGLWIRAAYGNSASRRGIGNPAAAGTVVTAVSRLSCDWLRDSGDADPDGDGLWGYRQRRSSHAAAPAEGAS